MDTSHQVLFTKIPFVVNPIIEVGGYANLIQTSKLFGVENMEMEMELFQPKK